MDAPKDEVKKDEPKKKGPLGKIKERWTILRNNLSSFLRLLGRLVFLSGLVSLPELYQTPSKPKGIPGTEVRPHLIRPYSQESYHLWCPDC